MKNLKVYLALGGSLVVAVAAACSSSSSGTTTTTTPDGGGDEGSISTGDDGAAGPTTCIPLSASGLCPKASDTCCLDLSGGLKPGTCEAPSLCTAMVQVQCISAANCGASQVCCADVGGGDGGLASLLDGGLGSLGIDASTLSLDGGASAIPGLAGLSFKVACQTSCSGSQVQACASNAECKNGGTCVPLSQLLGDAGAGIDAGALGGQLAMAGMNKACLPPAADGGTTVVPEAGPNDAAPSDAVAPTDAPAEAAH